MDAKTIYHDSRMDRLLIWIFSRKMASAVGRETTLKGYDGFVDLSQKIMQGRNPAQQKTVVMTVLQSLVPRPILWVIRTVFSPTKLVCELNAWFAAVLFQWLVGPCETASAEISTATQVKTQKSGVHIQKCRYLEQSGCVGMCINMCKLPTQEFFTQGFGIPLTMTPNFEDFSCEMVFGQVPPPLESEPIYDQPCLAGDCPTADIKAQACPRLRS